MEESSFLGHLLATEEISRQQYAAAIDYRDVVAEYARLHLLKTYPESGNLDRGGGHDNSDGTHPDYVARFKDACDDWWACQLALAETASIDHWARQVTENVVVRGYEMPHLVPSLRIGLNAIAKALRSAS